MLPSFPPHHVLEVIPIRCRADCCKRSAVQIRHCRAVDFCSCSCFFFLLLFLFLFLFLFLLLLLHKLVTDSLAGVSWGFRQRLYQTWPQAEACSACEQLRKNVVLERNQVASVVKLGAVATLLTLATTSSTQKELRQELRSGTWGKHVVLIDCLLGWLIWLMVIFCEFVGRFLLPPRHPSIPT